MFAETSQWQYESDHFQDANQRLVKATGICQWYVYVIFISLTK